MYLKNTAPQIKMFIDVSYAKMYLFSIRQNKRSKMLKNNQKFLKNSKKITTTMAK